MCKRACVSVCMHVFSFEREYSDSIKWRVKGGEERRKKTCMHVLKLMKKKRLPDDWQAWQVKIGSHNERKITEQKGAYFVSRMTVLLKRQKERNKTLYQTYTVMAQSTDRVRFRDKSKVVKMTRAGTVQKGGYARPLSWLCVCVCSCGGGGGGVCVGGGGGWVVGPGAYGADQKFTMIVRMPKYMSWLWCVWFAGYVSFYFLIFFVIPFKFYFHIFL